MARTGRFGRLPTESPDLSSQIVSLMEQYYAGQDRGILDAWANGGTYQGEKVNDKDILKHYRKRRSGFDKDDPMYDQWNQDIWQLRFQIADEKVQMQYRMGKIGPAAVAQHYRQWARKMPKNSSYYRNLMATAGDYMKASKAGGSAGSKGFDYQAMQNRIAAIEKKMADDLALISVLDEYAVSRGYILAGTSIIDSGNLTVFEAYDLNAILDGAKEYMLDKEDWSDFREGEMQDNPAWKGDRLSIDGINEAVRNIVQGEKDKIAEWRKAPYDMSSYIAGSRGKIREVRTLGRKVNKWLDAGAGLAVAWDIWTGSTTDRVAAGSDLRGGEEGMAGAIDPDDFLSGDELMLDAAKEWMSTTVSLGFQDESVAGMRMVIDVLEAKTPEERNTAIQNMMDADYTPIAIFGDQAGDIWGSKEAQIAWAQERAVMSQASDMLAEGTAAIFYHEKPSSTLSGLGMPPPSANFSMVAVETTPTGRTVMTDMMSGTKFVEDMGTTLVSQVSSDGKTVNQVMVQGTPIYGVDEKTVAGYEYTSPSNGEQFWVKPDATMPDGVSWHWVDPWDVQGLTKDHRADAIFLVPPDGTTEVSEAVFQRSLTEVVQEAIDTLEQTEGLSEEEVEVKRSAIEDAQPYIEARDWDAIKADPALREAYVRMHPQDFTSVGQYEGGEMEDDSVIAAINESGRRRYDADIPASREDMVFFTSSGQPRGSTDAGLFWQDPTLPQPATDAAAREAAMAQVNEGSYGERLANSGLYQDPNLYVDPEAYGGLPVTDGSDMMVDATDILMEDPEVSAASQGNAGRAAELIAEATSAGMGVATANQAIYLADAELRQTVQNNPTASESFHRTSFAVLGEDDAAAQAYYTQEWSMTESLLQYGPAVATVRKGGDTSEFAAAAGNMSGWGVSYADRAEKNEEAFNDAYGYDIEVNPQEPDLPVMEAAPTPAILTEGLRGVDRLDLMPATTPAPEVEPKTQPTQNVPQNLTPFVTPNVKPTSPISVPNAPGFAPPPPTPGPSPAPAPPPPAQVAPPAPPSAPGASLPPGVQGPTTTPPKVDITRPWQQ